ncbi:MAG: nickel pincer cofactor biosynthesis protein LarC [Spirochaetes bacterium]|nr:nickel pincer cofactor biosynthesis protein LarC [Spirochaetota bacterium]
MKCLYFDCGMGAAGDMLMASLLHIHPDPADFLDRLNGAGIPGVNVSAEPSVKCGITGLHVRVTVNGREEVSHDHAPGGEHGGGHGDGGHDHGHEHGDDGHHHHHEHGDDGHHHGHDGHHHHDTGHEHGGGSYHNIEDLIGGLNVSDAVKKNALSVYKLLAEAEGNVHGVPVGQVHFHEVGEKDAVADIVGVCMLMEELAPAVVLASPVNTGSGYVKCSHGLLPVPAPAAAHILRGVPIYSDGTAGELCTPTGAALLKHFVQEFGKMPELSAEGIGYGMGKKNFEKANCVRAFVGERPARGAEVCELACNLDDMTPEAVSYAQQLLLLEGALDVYTLPAGMKKGRPGLVFVCMCDHADKDRMAALIFKHTSTLGIREYASRRFTLQRDFKTLKSKLGEVVVKSSCGFGVKKSKVEYDYIARIAREKDWSLQQVLDALGEEGILE